MIHEIVKYGANILRTECMAAEVDDKDTLEIVNDLFESMRAVEGVGLAAPQIGIAKRICVIDVSSLQTEHQAIALINPKIVEQSGEQIGEEGCLSFPNIYGDVKRSNFVRIEAMDANGTKISTAGSGFYARALQHELDHLNGILFIDHLSSLKRQLMRSALKKLKKEGIASNGA